MKSLYRQKSKDDEQRHDSDLRGEERRLLLSWSQCLQSRRFHERLHHQNEAVEIKSEYGGDYVSTAPATREVGNVAGIYRRCQYDERDNANDVRGQQVFKWKEKASHARQNRSEQ